jgi:stage V sporulation protein R
MAGINKQLWDIKEHIREVASDKYGLDFFETIFEVVDYKKINEIAAYGGFPTRYPHWRFGMDYERLSKSAEYGLSKIYEMVINNDPSYAYLLEGNNLVDQKVVIAHVYGHVDFFKNNYFFSKTNRKMIDAMANHASRVRRYIDRKGIELVEDFVDTCLSIDNLIDYYSPFIERQSSAPDEDEAPGEVPKFKAKDYMESFINPDSFIASQKQKMADEAAKDRRFPRDPERDIMGFLLEHAPLERWEADILSIIREEAYYFAPQGQTKVMNEGWACVAPGTRVYTERGLITMEELVSGEAASSVSDGSERREVYDAHVIRGRETITIRTRRGLTLTGSTNHRVHDGGAAWRRLDELAVGDEVRVVGGADLWPAEQVALTWARPERVSLHDVAEQAGVSIDTVLRHRAGRRVRRATQVAHALVAYDSPENQALPQAVNKRRAITVPERFDARLGAFLGYLVGDGHISRVKRHCGLTSGDLEQIEAFAELAHDLFGLNAVVKEDGGRWRALVHSESLSDLLVDAVGLTHGPSAADKAVPEAILRSPEDVVAAFLRALFDCDGYAGKQGVILSTKSDTMSEQVQLLLLNFGVLSRRRLQGDGCWHVHVTGTSTKTFAARVGFGLERKQDALREYIDGHSWFKEERWVDEVVSIERGFGDVYDISVEQTHRYAAAGFVNHNSFWHSRILTRDVLDDSEIIDFADINSRVLATAPGQFNPYKLGVELYRDIEERWNTGRFGKEWEDVTDMEVRDSWNRDLGLGTEKIFEVRRHYNDVTFIDEFLTEDFARRHKMFTFGYNRKSGNWEIESREFKKVKNQLLDQLTNFGQPFIYVRDGNFMNRSELLLHHKFAGTELRVDWARGVLESLQRIWKRPVNIETILDDKGVLLTFDGTDHTEKAISYDPI